MSTLIFNGSPHHNGNTSYIIDRITAELKDTQIINSYDVNVSACVDCGYCKTHDTCFINDDMQKIYKNIIQADRIIIASPIYFSQITGSLLSLFSRLQLFYYKKYVNKIIPMQSTKKGYLVLTGGGSTKDISSIEKTAKIILNDMNAELVYTISSLNTDNIKTYNDTEVLKKIPNFK